MQWFEYKNKKHGQQINSFLSVLALTIAIGFSSTIHASGGSSDDDHSGFRLYPLGEVSGLPRLPSEPIPFAVVPERPALPIEWGCKFLGKGLIRKGFTIPGGATWSPCLLGFGTLRTAVQTYESIGPPGRTTEWRNRLDLFANLQLTQTEKCVVGVGVLDDNDFTKFSGYGFTADNRPQLEGSESHGPYIRAAFCEGDLGSLWPNLDPLGTKHLDWGFSFGRQQITFQEGIMINDIQDGIGIVRNTTNSFPRFTNVRTTFWLGLDSIDRGTPANIQRLRDGEFFGIFIQADDPTTTWALDIATIQDNEFQSTGGDGYWLGLAATQRAWTPWSRLGVVNTTYRINASSADGDNNGILSDGVLLSAEISWTPHSSDDVVYINPFYAIDTYSQASREPIVGGPLAALGISFASPSLGNHLSELNSFTGPLYGIAMGYQAFWDNHRRNLVLELAGTIGKNEEDQLDSAAFTIQLQQAIKQHYQLQFDVFTTYLQGRDNGSGARMELLVQF